jgi:hypothetical protein
MATTGSSDKPIHKSSRSGSHDLSSAASSLEHSIFLIGFCRAELGTESVPCGRCRANADRVQSGSRHPASEKRQSYTCTGTMWRRSCLSAAMPTDWRWNSGGGMRRIPQRTGPSFVSGPTTRTQGTRIDPTRPYYHRCMLSNGTNSSRKLSCHIQHRGIYDMLW